MKEQMKKIALLSLSLILTSAYSVSIVLPSLLQHFSEYTTAQVEILISAPSFAITVMIVLNAWLSRYMKDRPMIVGGLLLLSVSGMVPVFVQEYPVVLASRIFLGIGIGLINAKAISIFSEYYEGREKAALLGYRGSAEVLGSAVMTLVAGKLVLIRWNLAFWVYALGFVIVLLYLVWVPGSMETGQSAGSQSAGAEKESLEAEADEKRECWKKEVLTITIGDNESAKYWLSVLNELKNRGVKDILIICADGLTGIKEAIAAVFPKTEYQRCIVHQVRNTLKYVPDKDRKAFATDLKTIYQAADEQKVLAALDRVTEKWTPKYPNSMKRWKDNWDAVSPIFKFSTTVRKVIYTTNAIESLNSTYRKLNRQRSVFPSDTALLKALYLATFEATKKWTTTIRDWGQVYGELSIMYEGRLPE